jgi:hypothetical protein
MQKSRMWEIFVEELKKQGLDPEEILKKRSSNSITAELFSKRKSDKPTMIVHWADNKIKTGYIDGDDNEVHYLEAKVQVGDVFKHDDKLIGVGEEGLEDLQVVIDHFKTSIEPLELY